MTTPLVLLLSIGFLAAAYLIISAVIGFVRFLDR